MRSKPFKTQNLYSKLEFWKHIKKLGTNAEIFKLQNLVLNKFLWLFHICNTVCIIVFGAVNHTRSCLEPSSICFTFICVIKFILNKGVPSKLKGSVF